jgi:hypothetical protein
LPYSSDFNNAAWAKANCTIDTSTGIATPDANIDYQGIVSTAVAGVHNVGDGAVTTAASHTFSGVFKKADKDWVRLTAFRSGIGEDGTYFDLNNGVVGSTSGGSVTASGIRDLGNGNYLCWITWTATAVTWSMFIYSAEADGDVTFTGDGATIDTYAAFAQVEVGTSPSSRIKTAGATATRVKDDPVYNGDNVTASKGSCQFEVLFDDPGTPIANTFVSINDGGSADESIVISSAVTTGFANVTVTDSTVVQANITGTTDLQDGSKHTVEVRWETNNIAHQRDHPHCA